MIIGIEEFSVNGLPVNFKAVSTMVYSINAIIL